MRSAPRANAQPEQAQAAAPAAAAHAAATPAAAAPAPAVAPQGAPHGGHGEPHARRSRPEAPAFSFAPSEPPPPPTPEPARVASSSSHGAGLCDVCGASNAPSHRFCSVCGAALRAAAPAPAPAAAPRVNVGRTWVDGEAPLPAPAPLPATAPAPLPAPQPAPAPQGRLIAAPVLAIADSVPPTPGTVNCARCQGQNDATARFCKYCGSPLTPRVTPDQAPHDAGLAAAVVQAPAPRAVAPAPSVAPLDVPATIQTRAAVVAQAAQALPRGAQAGGAAQGPGAVRARLVVVTEDGSDGKSFDLAQPTITIGRTEGDILLGDDPYVSPRHARLEQVGGVWQIDDLASVNGVFVRVKGRRPLQKHDLILLGSQVLQFEPVNDEERQLGPVSQHGTRIFGTKPVRRLARLDQRTTAGLVGDVYYVHRDETTLGRELGDIVFTADAFLSRRHAMLRRDPSSGDFTLEDLESSNGTFVAIRSRSPIETGDRIRIGQHLFRFERSAEPGASAGRGASA